MYGDLAFLNVAYPTSVRELGVSKKKTILKRHDICFKKGEDSVFFEDIDVHGISLFSVLPHSVRDRFTAANLTTLYHNHFPSSLHNVKKQEHQLICFSIF